MLVKKSPYIFTFLICSVIWMTGAVSCACAADYYVDQKLGSDTYAGTSWALAKATIPAALVLASPDDTVHVAEGSYPGNIKLVADVTLLGGYPTGGGIRDYSLYESVVDIGYGIGSCFLAADGVTIDGFILTNGTGTDSGGVTYGGGIYCDGVSCIIRNSLFKNNSAGYGGGIGAINSDNLTIENNFFQDNRGNGPAIYVTHSSAAISRNLFTGNTGGARCGSIYCDNYSEAVISNNSFWNNDAGFSMSSNGGAIVAAEHSCPLIINNTFMNNTCAWKGSHIYCASYSNPVIRNNVFFEGIGVGAVAAEDSSYPSIDHNVFWNHSGAVFYQDTSLYMTVADMDDSVSECTENLDCDPKLVEPGKGDFHLLSDSCCIDNGNSLNAPSIDYDLETRPWGTGFDIGADEYMLPPVPCSSTSLIIILLIFTGIMMYCDRIVIY